MMVVMLILSIINLADFITCASIIQIDPVNQLHF